MCGKCNALHFLEECAASSSRANLKFTLCYAQGKVTLPPLAPPPEPLWRLLTSNKVDAKGFRQRIRSYNNACWPSHLWGPTWIPVLPNLAIILTVFTVSFTIGWGVYFLSLARHQNSPNCTSTIYMPSLMAEWAILVTWIETPCNHCKQCCMHATPTPAATKWLWNGSRAGVLN